MRLHLLSSAILAGSLVASVGAQTPAPPAVTNPTGPISLRDAVTLVLAQSPDLLAFDAGRRVAEARVLQSGRLPNPDLSTLIEDVGGPDGADVSGALAPFENEKALLGAPAFAP